MLLAYQTITQSTDTDITHIVSGNNEKIPLMPLSCFNRIIDFDTKKPMMYNCSGGAYCRNSLLYCSCDISNRIRYVLTCRVKFIDVHPSDLYHNKKDPCTSCEKRPKCLRYKLLHATNDLHEDIKKAILNNTECTKEVIE